MLRSFVEGFGKIVQESRLCILRLGTQECQCHSQELQATVRSLAACIEKLKV